jgi:hypothetical protein
MEDAKLENLPVLFVIKHDFYLGQNFFEKNTKNSQLFSHPGSFIAQVAAF